MSTPTVPTNAQDFRIWHSNFNLKLGGYASTFAITPAEVAETAADDLVVDYILGQIDVLSNDSQARTAYKNTAINGAIGTPLGVYPPIPVFGPVPPAVPAGIRARSVSIAQRIKSHVAATDAILQDLDLVAPVTNFDPNAYKAVINSVRAIAPGQVTVNFAKGHSAIQGVNVYMRRQGETVWRKLAFDSQSPYVDTTPLAVAGTPEVREYRVRGVIADDEIGQFSDGATATVS